ncbi:glycoside hydrolase family 16 protein [Actinomadura sp. DC4]|uniref:glycoside hydrolase family 16 protein n=1 Tax=Actinomadura sp. DC4 TaxID=3055069 RepID=UPI0025AFA6E4|nr:glycoside hydrolase family 16 protein [Actinomadura sp. DC4]MDN3352705.1 glycoside hydrolase family 16 protein [Actinomadura sp. DC4]
MAFDGVIRGAAAAVTLAVAAGTGGCSGHSSHVTQSGNGGHGGGKPAGYSKIWGAPVLSDDFGGTRLDTRKWQVYQAPDASSHRGVAAGTHVSGGQLTLVGGLYDGKDQGAGVISDLAQTYGRWEARLRSDPGAGYSATAFLWPLTMGHPEYAEIDFAEILGADRRSGGLFIHHGPDDRQVQRTIHTDFTKWHTVAVDWLPDHVTFWTDGKKTWTYKGSFVPRRSQMQLYLRNEMRSGFRRTSHTPDKITMQVDWIRVYRPPATSR